MQITVYIRKLTADNYSPQWMKVSDLLYTPNYE